MKSKVDKLDVDKLIPVSVDLTKLIDVAKDDAGKEDVYNAKIINIENEITDITNLATNSTPNAKINEANGKITTINNLVTNAFLNDKINDVKNEMPSTTNGAINTAV